MKYINHITLNTGHSRKTYPNEVDKRLYFKLKGIIKKSLSEEGVELFDGYILRSTQVPFGMLGTIFKNDAPILTTACSKNDKGDLWDALHSNYAMPLQTSGNNPTDTPYIADRIEIGAAMYPDSMMWTGDFSRCFGWGVLAPHKVR